MFLALPVSGAYASARCSSNVRSATMTVGDPATVTDYNATHQSGAPLANTTLKLASDIYQFNRGGTVVFGKNTFTLRKGTIVNLLCAGEAAGKPNDRPAMSLFTGSVTLATTQTNPGELFLDEGLITTNPGGPYEVRLTATRTPADTSYNGMMLWYRDYSNQPQGVTTIRSSPGIDVTPYVGNGVGNCRYSTTRAILSSHGAHGLGHTKKGGNAGGTTKFWVGSRKVS